ncbi:MAG: MBG domain-containing protein, partial [Verrucomicrobiota bacterium]|nr:MBG domain-containing protein [Verrucomicrobiota bacterium]
MKKIIATKVKRYTAGSLAFVTAMIFSLPGNMQAQQSQAITAPSIDDVTYGVAPFSVAATSSSGLTVSYGIAGPATVDNATGVLTVLGKGSVTVFFFQDGDADYFPAAPKVESFTVNGASATVTLADASVTYDGSGQSLTPVQADSAGATLNEAITVTYADAAGTAVASPTNVGVYTATATISSDSNYSGSATGTLTITSAAATVTISGTSHSHDGSQKEVTVETVPAGLTVTTTYSGGSFVAKDAVDATYEDDGTTIKTPAEPAVTSPSDAGDYTVSVSVVDDNYSGSASATLTIGSVTIDSAAVTYTGVAQAPAVTVVPADLTHTVAYTDSAGADVASPTNAGAYTVVVTVTDARYPGDTSASYTINPAALTATLGSLSTSYGLGAPSSAEWAATLSYSGFVGTDVAAAVDAAGLTVGYDKAVSDGGNYVATPADLSSGNYAISYVAGSLTVNKLSASVALSNTTQGYTGSVLGVTATPSVEGLAVTVVYRDANGALVASPTAKGTYYVTATIDDPNYEGSKTGTLKITMATTTLVLPDLPDVVYSADPITVNATVTGDRPVIYFVTGAAKASGNVITLNAAGSVRVTAYVAKTDDYESAFVADTFTVSKAPTSVTIADADSVYTGLGQSLTPSVVDSSGNAITVDAIDVTYADASGNAVASPTDVGVYTATATINDTKYGGSATGTLTILKAPLTITADDQTKEYLEANPTLTLKYTGFQNSEDSSVLSTQATVGTAADESSSLGDYGIVVYGASAANYTITHVDGTLTIEKNTIGITLSDTSQTYTGSALAVTATPSVADINLVVTYADSAGAAVASPTNAGTYAVTATVDSSLYRGT